jgi:hypothetical protein
MTITASATGGNWSSSAAWVGGVVPTAADDVILGPTSGNITLDASATNQCKTIDCTGYTGTLTLASAQTFTIAGNKLKFVAGMTFTIAGTVGTFLFTDAAAETVAVTSGGKTLPNITFASGLTSSSSTYQLQDSLTIGSLSFLTHTAGTFDTNNQTMSIGNFISSNTNVRTVNLGSSTITITNGSTPWSFSTNTNLTFNAGTSNISFSNAAVTFIGGSKTYYNVTFNGSGNPNVAGNNTFNNLTRNGNANTTDGVTFTGNQTVNGVFTLNANSAVNRLLLTGNTGAPLTLTLNGTFSVNYADIKDITVAGTAGNLTGTQIGNAGGNTNVTYTAARSLYWIGNAGNWNDPAHWALTSGGTGGNTPPLPQDSVYFDANSFSTAAQTITANMPRLGGDIDFTGVTNTPTLNFTLATAFHGSLKFVAGMNLSGTVAVSFAGRGSHTITSGGKVFTNNITFNSFGGVYTLLDDFATDSTHNTTFSYGTFNANNNNVTTAAFNSSNTNTRTITMGSGTWTLTGAGVVWNMATATNLTINRNTSTILITDVTSTAKTFAGGGKSYYTLTVTTGGTGAIIISGANTFATLNVTGGAATITFPASTTTTVGNFNVTGTAGNLVTINSSTSGTAAVLDQVTPMILNLDYLSIKDSNPVQTNTWFAGNHSTAVSNTGNWLFGSFRTMAFTGSMGFVGAGPKKISIPLSAGMSFVGAIGRGYFQKFTGSLGFSGSINKSAVKAMAGAVSFLGSAGRATARGLTGGLSFVGDSARSTARTFSGAVSFSGLISLARAKTFTAALTFSGTVTRSRVYTKVLTAAVGFSGTIGRQINKSIQATLGFTKPNKSRPSTFGTVGFGRSYFGEIPELQTEDVGQLIVKYIKSKGLYFTGALTMVFRKAWPGRPKMESSLSDNDKPRMTIDDQN